MRARHWVNLLIAIFAVSPARAETLSVATTVNAGISYVGHTRASDAPINTTERGALPAAAVEATVAAPSPVFARARLVAMTGRTDYEVWDPNTEVFRTTTANTWIAPDVAIGARLEIDPNVQLVEYVGFAYHYWRREIEAVGAATWFQRWGAVPIGLRLEARLAEPLELTVEAAVAPSLLAAVRVESDAYSPIDLEPAGKLGGRARAGLTYSVAPRFLIGALIAWEYTAFGESPTVVVRDQSGAPVAQPGAPGGVRWTMHPAEHLHQLSAMATVGVSL
jgi:hypothetical protein